MPQFPFRQPVNTEDSPDDQQQFTPPDYEIKADDKSGSKFTPPDYEIKPESELDKAKKGVTLKGSLEGATKATKRAIDDFVASTFTKNPNTSAHPYIRRVLGSQNPASEPLAPTKSEITGMPTHEPDTWWGGFRKGLYDEFVKPLSSPAGIAGLMVGEDEASPEAKPVVSDSLPIRETPYRMGGSIQPEIRSTVDGRTPLQVQADAIVNRMTPPKDIAPEPAKLSPGVDSDLQAKADAIIKQIQEAQNKPVEAKPKLKANADGTFTDVKSGITVDKTGKPVQAQAVPEKKPFVNPFEKPAAIAEVTTPQQEFAKTVQGAMTPPNQSNEPIAPPQEELPIREPLHGQIYPEKSIDPTQSTLAASAEKFNMARNTPNEPAPTPEQLARFKIPGHEPPSDWKAPDYEIKSEEAPKAGGEKPTATFSYHQTGFDNEPIPMYRVEGNHSLSGSDVSADTLKQNGIEVPETPPASQTDDITEMQGGLGGVGGGKKKYPKSAGPLGPTLDKLFQATLDAKDRMTQQEAINAAERAKRFAAFKGVKAEGAAGAAKSLSKLRGEFEKVNPGEGMGLDQNETDSLFTAVKRAKISEGEKARGYTALFKLMNGDGVPVRSDLATLDRVFGNQFADRITEMHGGIGAVGLKISKIANTMKSLQNSISLAAPLRHGIGLATRREFYPAARDMFKFFADKDFYNNSMDAIQSRPKAQLANEAGLFFARPGSLQDSEEEFLNSYAGQIPVAKHMVNASNRAYTGFLNKLRADAFDSMTQKAQALGVKMYNQIGDEIVPTKEAKAIANYINVASGRGNLGRLNRVTNELNTLLWSPRMIASRVEMLANPKLYTDLPKGMRLEGLKSLFGIAALGTMIDTMSAYAGAKVSTNILSSDAGKSRFGTHLIDPWGGFQQYVVAAARFLAGKTDSNIPTSRLEIAGRFAANKESPVASLAHSILTAKKFTGDPNKVRPNLFGRVDPKAAGSYINEFNQPTSVQREVASRFLPIFSQDINDLIASDPKWADDIGLTAAMTGASLAGMAQNYPEAHSGKLKLGSSRKLTVR